MNKLPIGTKLKFKLGEKGVSYFGKIIGYGNNASNFYFIEYNSSQDSTIIKISWSQDITTNWIILNNICYPDEQIT